MKLGKYAIERRYFEPDDEFPDSIKSILDGYNEAARRSAFNARYAIRSGESARYLKAQYWETVCQTIEEVIAVVACDKPRDFEFPTMPSFQFFGEK
jgi:hypothetical protein